MEREREREREVEVEEVEWRANPEEAVSSIGKERYHKESVE